MALEPLSFPEYNWQIAYRDALLETSPARMAAKIRAAEEIVEARLKELMHSADGSVERQALEDALRALRYLERHS
jgi:hypothetical protein